MKEQEWKHWEDEICALPAAAHGPALAEEAATVISAQTSRVQVTWHFWTDTWPHLYLQRMYLETS